MPSSREPSAANLEPCSGQSQDDSAAFHCRMPPRCGQTADTEHTRPSTFEVATTDAPSRCTRPSPGAGALSSEETSAPPQPRTAWKPTLVPARVASARSRTPGTRRLISARHDGSASPVTCATMAIAAAGPLVIPHLWNPVATWMSEPPGRRCTIGSWFSAE